MKLTRRRLVAGVGALAISGGSLLVSMVGASADTVTPGWEPDPNAIGSITFYDTTGQAVTSGKLDDKPFAAYAVAGHAGRAGDTHAELYAYTPVVGTNPQTWSGDQLSASAYSPTPAGAPSAVTAGGTPIVAGTSADLSMDDYIGEYPNSIVQSGYTDLYEMRIFTSGPGQEPDTSQYDRVDIQVNTAADTWQVVTSGTVAPPSVGKATISGHIRVGDKVTCKATVTGATAVRYAWLAGGHALSGDTKSTLTVPASADKKILQCKVTASNTGGTASGTSAGTKVAEGAALKDVKKPTVSGKFTKGHKLKASPGKWSPSASHYDYQWTLNGHKIKHATKSDFRISSKDVGKKLGCTVKAVKTGYASGEAKTASHKVSK